MIQTDTTGRILFPDGNVVRAYEFPRQVVSATRVDAVLPALAELDRHVAQGRHVAGYIAYEAAGAFDPALQTHALEDMPLLWFGVYENATIAPLPRAGDGAVPVPDLDWRPRIDQRAYFAAFETIRGHIAAGDTYQVNFTYPMEARFTADPEAWFLERLAAQLGRYGAYLDLGRQKILSLSPELFFALDGATLTTRPMKGTRPRGLSSAQDGALAAELRQSPKERAENLMIVDMMRNDLGRVCSVNSIAVPELFSIERYPTVWQMTSTVTGQCAASIPEILSALFPSASVTGAPKIETMKIIRELESQPRGAYCGAIGWWAPGRQARFNVAIRTATLDTETKMARYPVGSGITWDSDPAREHQECAHKTAVLRYRRPPFSIVSALRLDCGGYALLEHHLERMAASAGYFGFPFDAARAREALLAYACKVSDHPAKVRIASDQNGEIGLSHETLPAPGPWTGGLALYPIDSQQPWTHHKTTHRQCYDEARATRPDCEAVLLWTKDGRLTEAVNANIVLRIGGRRYTPPQDSGLLAGVYRRHLLETGQIEERTLTLDDLREADERFVVNSVRGWIPLTWVPHPQAPASLDDIRQHP